MVTLPPVSQFKSRQDWQNCLWDILIKQFTAAKEKQEIEKLFNELLTASEKRQIINRAAAIALLNQGKSYSQIGEALWLSPTTISAIKKSLRDGKEYISRYTREKAANKGKKKMRKPSFLYEGNKRDFNKRMIMPHGKLVFPQKRKR